MNRVAQCVHHRMDLGISTTASDPNTLILLEFLGISIDFRGRCRSVRIYKAKKESKEIFCSIMVVAVRECNMIGEYKIIDSTKTSINIGNYFHSCVSPALHLPC